MKIKIASLFTLFFAMYFSIELVAQNKYIVFDPSCMDRLEYETKRKRRKEKYVAYHININAAEKIILEVERESKTPQSALPSDVISCNSPQFNERFVESANKDIYRVFIVVEGRNQRYYVSPVKMVAYQKYQNNVLTYVSPKYHFGLDLTTGDIGSNIAVNQRIYEIFFEGVVDTQNEGCSSTYLFRRRSLRDNTNLHSEFLIVPEIGIVEERSGNDVEEALDNAFLLDEINNRDLKSYMRLICQNKGRSSAGFIQTPSAADFPSSPIVNRPPTYDNTGNKVTLTSKGNFQSSPTLHMVKKGETLYRISKKYKVSVQDIQDWNAMGSSTIIHSGDQLIVSQPNNNGNLASSSRTVPNSFDNINSPDRIAAPRTYNDPNAIQPNYTTPAPPPFQSQEEIHVIRAGETVASIARKYGFTEAKLREINRMGPFDNIRIGQQLKVSDCDCPPGGGDNTTPLAQYDFEKSNSSQSNRNNNYSSLFNSQNRATRQSQPRPGDYNYVSPSGNRLNGRPTSYNNENQQTPQNYVNNLGKRIHVVKEGDNLYQIAKLYGTKIERLLEINNLGYYEVLMPNQRILVE